MRRWKLIWRSIRHSPGAYARLGFAAAAIGALVMMVNVVGTTTERTVGRDFAAMSFDRPVAFALSSAQVGDNDDLVKRTDAVLTVRLYQTLVSQRGAAPRVSTTGVVAGQPESPSWMDGRYPERAGEVALSTGLATWLDVDSGDVISSDAPDADTQALTVVGVFPVLGDREYQTAIVRTPKSERAPVVQVRRGGADEWREADPDAEALSNWSEFSEYMSRPLEVASTLRSVELVLYLAGAGAIAFATIALRRSRIRDIEALRAAGMSDRSTARLFVWTSMAATTVGLTLGFVASFVGLYLAKGTAGALVDEAWTQIDVSPVRLVVFVAITLIAGATTWLSSRWSPRRRSEGSEIRISAAISVVGAITAVIMVGVAWNRPGLFDGLRGGMLAAGYVVVICTVIAASVPTLIDTLIRPNTLGLRALARSTQPSRSVAIASALFTSALCLLVSASLFSDYETKVGPSSIPRGGLWVESARPLAGHQIADRYRRETGREAVVLESFPENVPDVMYRVVPASAAECYETKRSVHLCMDANPSIPIARAAVRSSGITQTDEWIVSPTLLGDADEILLVKFDPSDEQATVIETTLAPARRDDGQFTSDLVSSGIAAVAPLGTDIGHSPDTADVYLPGFSSLDIATQRRVQRTVYELSPYAISNLATRPDYALLAQAWTVAALGLLIASTLLCHWNASVWRSRPTVIAAFESTSGSGRSRRRIVAGSVFTQAASMAIALLLVNAVAHNVLHAFSPLMSEAIRMYVVVIAAVLLVGGYVQVRQLRGDLTRAPRQFTNARA